MSKDKKIIWIVCVGEPVPCYSGFNERLHRAGEMANIFSNNNVKTTWWTSDFNHFKKTHYDISKRNIQVNDNLEIRALKTLPYHKNTTPKRFLSHFLHGFSFFRHAIKSSGKRPDVIICSLPTIDLCFATIILTKFFPYFEKTKVYLDVRDLWPDIFKDILPSRLGLFRDIALWLPSRMARFSLRNCYGVLGVSQKYLDWGLEKAGRLQSKRDMVVPLGYRRPISVGSINKSLEEQINNKKIVWFIGTFGQTYDLTPIIEAAIKILDKEQETVFIFSGQGDNYSLYESKCKGYKDIILTGWIEKNEIAWFLNNAAIGVAAYRKGAPQGIPNKICEYLSTGLPIVSSLRGESEDLLSEEKCGLTYDTEDVDGLVKILNTLLKDDVYRAKMSNNARKTYERFFDLEKVYTNFLHVISNKSESTKEEKITIQPLTC